jgi:hypothetical protein
MGIIIREKGESVLAILKEFSFLFYGIECYHYSGFN